MRLNLVQVRIDMLTNMLLIQGMIEDGSHILFDVVYSRADERAVRCKVPFLVGVRWTLPKRDIHQVDETAPSQQLAQKAATL